MGDIGWQGIFELELIRTAPERFVPIDLNPRPYGSLALAASAGVALPALWCGWLLDRDPRPPAPESAPVRARPGYRYRWEDADLRNVASCLRRGRLGAALRAARPRRRVTHAYFRLRDPLPLLVRGLDIVGNRVGGDGDAPGADRDAAGGDGNKAGDEARNESGDGDGAGEVRSGGGGGGDAAGERSSGEPSSTALDEPRPGAPPIA